MKIVVTMPVRNEQWCVGLTARAVLDWADSLVMLDHASTDASREIETQVAAEYPGRVTVLLENDPTWEEMRHRQRLLDAARELGATHIAMVDADEIITGNLLERIRPIIEDMPMGVLQLPWVCLARGIDRYYAAGVWFNNWVSCAFPDQPGAHWKARSGYDFHHRHPMGHPANYPRPIQQHADDRHQGGLMHLQFVSERRLRAKQANYILREMLRWPGRSSVGELNAMYGRAIYESDPRRVATAECHKSWWEPYFHLLKYLDLSDSEAPWQELDCRAIVQENGMERFRGADLFGVVGENAGRNGQAEDDRVSLPAM